MNLEALPRQALAHIVEYCLAPQVLKYPRNTDLSAVPLAPYSLEDGYAGLKSFFDICDPRFDRAWATLFLAGGPFRRILTAFDDRFAEELEQVAMLVERPFVPKRFLMPETVSTKDLPLRDLTLEEKRKTQPLTEKYIDVLKQLSVVRKLVQSAPRGDGLYEFLLKADPGVADARVCYKMLCYDRHLSWFERYVAFELLRALDTVYSIDLIEAGFSRLEQDSAFTNLKSRASAGHLLHLITGFTSNHMWPRDFQPAKRRFRLTRQAYRPFEPFYVDFIPHQVLDVVEEALNQSSPMFRRVGVLDHASLVYHKASRDSPLRVAESPAQFMRVVKSLMRLLISQWIMTNDNAVEFISDGRWTGAQDIAQEFVIKETMSDLTWNDRFSLQEIYIVLAEWLAEYGIDTQFVQVSDHYENVVLRIFGGSDPATPQAPNLYINLASGRWVCLCNGAGTPVSMHQYMCRLLRSSTLRYFPASYSSDLGDATFPYSLSSDPFESFDSKLKLMVLGVVMGVDLTRFDLDLGRLDYVSGEPLPSVDSIEFRSDFTARFHAHRSWSKRAFSQVSGFCASLLATEAQNPQVLARVQALIRKYQVDIPEQILAHHQDSLRSMLSFPKRNAAREQRLQHGSNPGDFVGFGEYFFLMGVVLNTDLTTKPPAMSPTYYRFVRSVNPDFFDEDVDMDTADSTAAGLKAVVRLPFAYGGQTYDAYDPNEEAEPDAEAFAYIRRQYFMPLYLGQWFAGFNNNPGLEVHQHVLDSA